MTLSEIKNILKQSTTIAFALPDGKLVSNHFHVTEVGKVTKDFIDCGGVRRSEVKANFQLWEADDYDHRLHPEKLVSIIELAEKVLELGDQEIEVEYQGDTIGKYNLAHDGKQFLLVAQKTACLAQDQCMVPDDKPKFNLSDLTASSCTPGGGCC